MLVLISTGITQHSKSSSKLKIALYCFLVLFVFFCAPAQAQVFDNFLKVTADKSNAASQKLLARYQQQYGVATIDKQGNLTDQLPNYISKVLVVDGAQQSSILKHSTKFSAVDLLIISEAKNVSMLPPDLFENLPALKYLVVEYRSAQTTITEKQLRDKFQGQDIEDKVILLKPLGEDN